MDKSNIIKSLKGQDEEKVGFSLKLPKSLKEELHSLCEKESVSMNALIVATLQSLVNDECGKSLKVAKSILLEFRTDTVNTLKNLDTNDNGVYIDEDEARHAMNLQSKIHKIDEFLGV